MKKEQSGGFKLSCVRQGYMRASDVEEGVRAIHAVLDAGINYLNTADFYGSGSQYHAYRRGVAADVSLIPKEKAHSSYMINLRLEEKGLIQNF